MITDIFYLMKILFILFHFGMYIFSFLFITKRYFFQLMK